MSTTCIECGAEIPEAAKFCKFCGAAAPEEPGPLTAGESSKLSGPATSSATNDWRRFFRVPRGRHALWLARTALAVTLVGTGFTGGWFAGSERSLVEAEASRKDTPDRTFVSSDVASMPDLRGLGLRDAQQILADLGIAASEVSTVDQPAAGPSGLVVGQSPVFGYSVEGLVTLNISRPAKVPEFVGRSATDVLADLDELGAETETVTQYVPGVPPGSVASISPAPGTPLPVAVRVVIAAEPESRPLVEVAAVEDNCSIDDDSLDGQTYRELLVCETDRYPINQTWVIKKAATTLAGIVGVPDTTEPGSAVEVQLLADGTLRRTLTVGYGQTVPFRIDVTGVLRLTLRVRSQTRDYSTAGFAHLRLLGDATALDSLEDSGW